MWRRVPVSGRQAASGTREGARGRLWRPRRGWGGV